MSDPADQMSGEDHSQSSDGARIMPLGTDAANHAAGSLAVARALVIQDCRLGLRGKNDSVRPPGIHRLQCIRWRDGESRANHVLRSGPIRVPASISRWRRKSVPLSRGETRRQCGCGMDSVSSACGFLIFRQTLFPPWVLRVWISRPIVPVEASFRRSSVSPPRSSARGLPAPWSR